jgi:serine protease AprX
MYSMKFFGWIRSAGQKLDPSLRRHLIRVHQPSARIPCFLHKLVDAIKFRMSKHKVIVEKEEGLTLEEGLLIDQLCESCGKVSHRFQSTAMLSLKVSSKGIQKISNDSGVRKVYLDREVSAYLDVASPTIEAPPIWDEGLTGKGSTIAIIDTGTDPHPDIRDRIVAFKDFVNNRTDPYDDNGHGTHVAGDAAGNGSASNGEYKGTAYESNLVGVKVLDKRGGGSLSNVIAGVDWCIQNKERYGINVINLSLGSPETSTCENDPVCRAVEKAWAEGLVVCVAAGNEGPESNTIGSPGIAPSVITVGAMNDQNTVDRSDDNIASFSSRGPTMDGRVKPDVVAPGVNIISLRAPSSYLDKQMGGSGSYTTMSGTSMATPICAGVVALILEGNPSLTPNQVKEILLQTAQDRGLDPNTQGEGYINAQAAVQEAIKR